MNKLIISTIIVLAAVSRLIPHPPNFTPIIAMGLFGSAYIKNRSLAMFIPICAMFIADMFLGYHSTIYWVYGSLILISILGMLVINRISIKNCTIATISGSLLFFIATNFGVWLTSTYYPKNIEGLIICYTAALPFLVNTLAGSIFYSIIMFGGYEILRRNLSHLYTESIHN